MFTVAVGFRQSPLVHTLKIHVPHQAPSMATAQLAGVPNAPNPGSGRDPNA